MTTTFIYAHLMPKSAVDEFLSLDQLPGVSKTEWENAQKEAMGDTLKTIKY